MKKVLRLVSGILFLIQIIVLPDLIIYTTEAIQNDESIAFIIGTILGGSFLFWIALYLNHLAKKR